jgi:hypothetical protein
MIVGRLRVGFALPGGRELCTGGWCGGRCRSRGSGGGHVRSIDGGRPDRRGWRPPGRRGQQDLLVEVAQSLAEAHGADGAAPAVLLALLLLGEEGRERRLGELLGALLLLLLPLLLFVEVGRGRHRRRAEERGQSLLRALALELLGAQLAIIGGRQSRQAWWPLHAKSFADLGQHVGEASAITVEETVDVKLETDMIDMVGWRTNRPGW